jgi:L-alanine-DL-glutamate epimerase-like enolase superfamily enzyme
MVSLASSVLPSAADDTIVKFEYFRVRPRWLFVRIESSNGHVGWGEATLEGLEILHLEFTTILLTILIFINHLCKGIPKLSKGH